MKRSEGRIFTTHTGSLPRPDALVELLAKVARGEEVDGSALERLADASTLEVIRQQARAGVDVINSGEQSRAPVYRAAGIPAARLGRAGGGRLAQRGERG